MVNVESGDMNAARELIAHSVERLVTMAQIDVENQIVTTIAAQMVAPIGTPISIPRAGDRSSLHRTFTSAVAGSVFVGLPRSMATSWAS